LALLPTPVVDAFGLYRVAVGRGGNSLALLKLGLLIPVGERNVVPHVWLLLGDADSDVPDTMRPVLAEAAGEIRWLDDRIQEVEKPDRLPAWGLERGRMIVHNKAAAAEALERPTRGTTTRRDEVMAYR